MSISKFIALVPVAALAVACGGGGEGLPEASAPEAPAAPEAPEAPAADAPAADAPAADAPAGGDATPAAEEKK